MKTVTITDKGQISIPKELRDFNYFSNGSKVTIIAFEDRVEIRPLKEINEKLYPALLSQKSLAKDWLNEEENEAWKDL